MIDNNDIQKLSEVFVTKQDLQEVKDDILEFKFETKQDLQEVKDDILEFKNEILTGQDEILGKLDILLGDKTVGDEQDKRQKKVLEIHNNALKGKGILSTEESLQIDKLQVF